MTCDEFWNQMPELAGAAAPLDHVQQCPSCAQLFERQRALSAGLRRMARELEPREAPPAVEARLRNALRVQTGGTPRPLRRYWWAWASAAALIVAAFFLTLEPRMERNRLADSRLRPAQSDLESADFDPDFIPLPFGAADSAGWETADDPDLVQVEVPRSALIALGLPVTETGAPRVEAVLALGSDGTLRGIELVQ
ncbi:MAG TPA: hypothetical protein VKT49_16210 [Bryobacteraceae bacterium]|nr:hypothetical protein [Bryobacteraceae bacterium]